MRRTISLIMSVRWARSCPALKARPILAGRCETCAPVGPMLVIGLAALWTLPEPCLLLHQSRAALADPTDPLRRHARHQGLCRDLAGDDGAGRDHRIGADMRARQDHAPRSKARAISDADRHEPSGLGLVSSGDLPQRQPATARGNIVCKTDAGTDKHVISDLDPVPHHCLVL